MMTSKKQDWQTPASFFDKLQRRFNFTVDGAANITNHKLPRWFGPGSSERQNTLSDPAPWGEERIFINPPYQRKGPTLYYWVKRAAEEAKLGTFVVMLVPARTDTKWFHEFIWQKPDVTIEFVKGRLKFEGRPKSESATFPSMIVIFEETKS